MKRFSKWILRYLVPPLAALLAPLFALVARTGYGADICRRFGFHPLRIHFYTPVPAYEGVPEPVFRERQSFPGFALDPDKARRTLEQLSRFESEARWPERAPEPGRYGSDNDQFGYSSAAMLHTMIRAHGTRKVVEVGGGYSTLISLAALERNHGPAGLRFLCVEPYPRPWLAGALARYGERAELIRQPVERLAPERLADLEPNDILFIDSSHASKLASDVNFLFLQVVPRLRPGVIVHVHDIYIPYEYPRVHFFGENKLFWNEQYLLQALLTNNPTLEILLPGFFVQTDMATEFGAAFPAYDAARHRKSSSFWMRRTG